MSNKSIYKNPTYFYTYQIYNTKTGKFYIGVRSSKIDPIKDIGIRYFSSSSDKDFITDQKLNPQDYEYTVLGIFPTRKEAIAEEIFLHNLYNVGQNKRFYNKAKQTSTGFYTAGKFPAKDAKTGESVGRVSINDPRVLSGEIVSFSKGTFPAKDAKTGEIIGMVSINDPRVLSGELVGMNKGNSLSNDQKLRLSEVNRGKKLSEESKQKMCRTRKGNYPSKMQQLVNMLV